MPKEKLTCTIKPWGKYWFIDKTSKYHREDGPAIIYRSGRRTEWWLYDKQYNKQDYLKELAILRGQEHANEIALIYA